MSKKERLDLVARNTVVAGRCGASSKRIVDTYDNGMHAERDRKSEAACNVERQKSATGVVRQVEWPANCRVGMCSLVFRLTIQGNRRIFRFRNLTSVK